VIKQGVHGRRPRAGRAADDVTVDHDGTMLIFHPHQCAAAISPAITDYGLARADLASSPLPRTRSRGMQSQRPVVMTSCSRRRTPVIDRARSASVDHSP
jgi:hypothetical protein